MADEPLINIEEFKKIQKQFEEIKKRAGDLRPAKEKIGEVLYEDQTLRFKSSPSTEVGGDVYGGVEWKKLSQYTFFLNPSRKGGKVLIDSGELQRTLTQPGQAGQIFEVDETGFKFGYNLGDKNDLQKDRPIVFVHNKLQKRLGETITEYFLGNSEDK